MMSITKERLVGVHGHGGGSSGRYPEHLRPIITRTDSTKSAQEDELLPDSPTPLLPDPDHLEVPNNKIVTTETNNTKTASLRRHYSRRKSLYNMSQTVKLQKKQRMKRLVDKDGFCNVLHTHVGTTVIDYMNDLLTTIIDLRWRWVLIFFALSYVVGWLLFSVLWYGLAWWHDDIDYMSRNMTDVDPDWEPCVYNVENWIGSFLFSIETQTTIGYGFRSVTEKCWFGAFLVIVQSVFSCLVDAILIGCVFAKIARPKKRAATLKFSKNAVIAERDGHMCLMFRIGDIRQSHLFAAQIRAQIIQAKVTKEGECIPLFAHPIDLGAENNEHQLLLIWPIIITHIIDERSPLYDMSSYELSTCLFELIVILEGVVEQTGLLCQARTSYLPHEILWGHRFSSHLISPHEDNEHLKIDYREFNTTYAVLDTPTCSARELDQLRAQGLDFKSRKLSISENFKFDEKSPVANQFSQSKINDYENEKNSNLKKKKTSTSSSSPPRILRFQEVDEVYEMNQLTPEEEAELCPKGKLSPKDMGNGDC